MRDLKWCVYIISESGKKFPHWGDTTRHRAREEVKRLKAQCGGKLPSGVRIVIEKVGDC